MYVHSCFLDVLTHLIVTSPFTGGPSNDNICLSQNPDYFQRKHAVYPLYLQDLEQTPVIYFSAVLLLYQISLCCLPVSVDSG